MDEHVGNLAGPPVDADVGDPRVRAASALDACVERVFLFLDVPVVSLLAGIRDLPRSRIV